jgi:hypothetical protein
VVSLRAQIEDKRVAMADDFQPTNPLGAGEPAESLHWEGLHKEVTITSFPFRFIVESNLDSPTLGWSSPSGETSLFVCPDSSTTIEVDATGISLTDAVGDSLFIAYGDEVEDKFVIDPRTIAPSELKTCPHGISPRERCPKWPNC